MAKHKRLWDSYRFPGFVPSSTVSGLFGDPQARVISLRRREKKRFVVNAVAPAAPGTITKPGLFAIFHVGAAAFSSQWKAVASIVRSAAR